MFCYLHLTRPPLEQADPSQPLLITPNIANDLRTEHPSPGPSGIDVFYAWVKCLQPAALSEAGLEDAALTESLRGGRTLGPMTVPQKLTTWTGNTYKEVHVFPPKEALNGFGRWQLLLCTRPAESGTFIPSIDFSLSTERFGKYVLPILSSPVLFIPGSRNNNASARRGAEKKQVQNERVFKFPSSLWDTTTSVTAAVGPLRITEHLSYDLDKKVWDSGVGLSHWFVSIAMIMAGTPDSESGLPSVVQNLMRSKDATILELGAGTGLVSLVLSTLLSHCTEQARARVVATDLESAMEILETNISKNAHCYTSVRPKAAVLDWDDDTLPEEVRDGVDFIIMADVTYNTSSFPSLIRTLSQLSRLRRPPPAVLLAYKERDPDERRLWNMAQEVGLRLLEIARVPGAGGMPVEIFAGTFDSDNLGKSHVDV